MGEFKRGELHTGSKKGPLVRSRKQAEAIAMSEARKAGEGVPRKKKRRTVNARVGAAALAARS